MIKKIFLMLLSMVIFSSIISMEHNQPSTSSSSRGGPPPLVEDDDRESITQEATQLTLSKATSRKYRYEAPLEGQEDLLSQLPYENLLEIVEDLIPQNTLRFWQEFVELYQSNKKLPADQRLKDSEFLSQFSSSCALEELKQMFLDLNNLAETNRALYDFLRKNIVRLSKIVINKLNILNFSDDPLIIFGDNLPNNSELERLFFEFHHFMSLWFENFFKENKTKLASPLQGIVLIIGGRIGLIETIEYFALFNNKLLTCESDYKQTIDRIKWFLQILKKQPSFNPDHLSIYTPEFKMNQRLLSFVLNFLRENDKSDLVSLLLKLGANPNKIDNDRHFPLALAIRNSPLQDVEALINKNVNLNPAGKGSTPLQMLLNEFIYQQNKSQELKLWVFRIAGRSIKHLQLPPVPFYHLIEKFLQKGANPNSLSSPNAQQIATLPLIEIIKSDFLTNNQIEGLIKLLKFYGADINKHDAYGKIPLEYAYKNESIFDFLISEGADINSKDRQGKTPLIRAIEQKNESFIKFLLDPVNEKYNVDFNSPDDNGMTPLMHATQLGNGIIVRKLLKPQTNFSLSNRWGDTAADIARNNHHEFILNLIEEAQKDGQ